TVLGVPMTYFTSGGWKYIKTTQGPTTIHMDILPKGTANSSTHVAIVPTQTIGAEDYPRYLLVHALVHCSVFTISSSLPQLIFFYDSVNVVVVRVLNANHVATFTWSTIVPANTTHSMYLNMNIAATPTSGVAT